MSAGSILHASTTSSHVPDPVVYGFAPDRAVAGVGAMPSDVADFAHATARSLIAYDHDSSTGASAHGHHAHSHHAHSHHGHGHGHHGHGHSGNGNRAAAAATHGGARLLRDVRHMFHIFVRKYPDALPTFFDPRAPHKVVSSIAEAQRAVKIKPAAPGTQSEYNGQ